MQFAAFQISE